MNVTIQSDVAVSENLAAGSASCMCAFPDAAVDSHGAVHCIYRQGETKHSADGVLLIQRSDDNGVSWSSPVTVIDRSGRTPPETATAVGLIIVDAVMYAAFYSCEMVDSDVYLFDEKAEEFDHYTNLVRSDDGGVSWSAPQRIDMAPYGGARCGIGTSPYLLPDGALSIPLEAQIPAGPQGTVALVSSDGGETFAPPQLLIGDETGELSLCDARFLRLRDGSYLQHLWTYVDKEERTINVRQSRSADGLTWSEPVETSIVGQISAPLEVRPGVLLSAVNHRDPPKGNQLWWSTDGGASWCESPIQMWDLAAGRVTGVAAGERGDSGDSGLWDRLPSFAFGTPVLRQLADASLLLIYWATIDDIAHIRACHFQIAED